MTQQLLDATTYTELQDTIIRNVSHELRTPLTIIRVYAELLNQQVLGDLAPEQRDAMHCIVSRAFEMQNIVARMGILMTLKTSSGVAVPISMRILTEKVLDTREAQFTASGLAYTCTIEEDLPLVKADPAHLESAIDCLVENAIKFTESGGSITLDIYSHGGYVCFNIQDTGIGIHQEEFPRIFNRFYQVDPSTTRTYGGLGLGLAVVKEVVEAYQGIVEVRSQQDYGTTFTIRLPIANKEDGSDAIANAFAQYHRISYE